MWMIFAFASAFFAGITAILSKVGVKNINSNLATAVRTTVVFMFAWLLAAVRGTLCGIADINAKTAVFLVLSGLATGASWLCYFKALQSGDANKVAPIDKSSTVMSMLLAAICLGEGITPIKAVCMFLIALGTYLMIDIHKPSEKNGGEDKNYGWIVWALLSAVFAAATSILAKIGIAGIDSDLGTAIRTTVVLVMAWIVVAASGGMSDMGKIKDKNLFFLTISGAATGLSWFAYYRALQTGPASVVVPIDKLSILVTVAFSRIVLGEKLTKRAAVGLAALVFGTLLLVLRAA